MRTRVDDDGSSFTTVLPVDLRSLSSIGDDLIAVSDSAAGHQLVEPGEDPAGGRVAAGDNPGQLRSEVAFVGCRMSGAPRGFPLPPPAAHLLYRLATPR